MALQLYRDIGGTITYARKPAKNIERVDLSAGAAQSFTFPNTSYSPVPWQVLITYRPLPDGSPLPVWVAYTPKGATPITATPATGTMAAGDSELEPAMFVVSSGDTLSFYSDNTTATVCIVYYEGNIGNS